MLFQSTSVTFTSLYLWGVLEFPALFPSSKYLSPSSGAKWERALWQRLFWHWIFMKVTPIGSWGEEWHHHMDLFRDRDESNVFHSAHDLCWLQWALYLWTDCRSHCSFTLCWRKFQYSKDLIASVNFETWCFLVRLNPKALRFLKGSDGRFFYLCPESSNKENWNITHDLWTERDRGTFAHFPAHSLKSKQGRKWEKLLSSNEHLMGRRTRDLFCECLKKEKKRKWLRSLTTKLTENVWPLKHRQNNWPVFENHECGLLTSQSTQGYFLWLPLITNP